MRKERGGAGARQRRAKNVTCAVLERGSSAPRGGDARGGAGGAALSRGAGRLQSSSPGLDTRNMADGFGNFAAAGGADPMADFLARERELLGADHPPAPLSGYS